MWTVSEMIAALTRLRVVNKYMMQRRKEKKNNNSSWKPKTG